MSADMHIVATDGRRDGSSSPRWELWRLGLRGAGILIVTVGCLIAVASGSTSRVRVALALAFFLFVPGLALGELLEIRDLAQRLTIAIGASLGLETVLATTLVYTGAFSVDLAVDIMAAFTVTSLGLAVGRALGARRGAASLGPSDQ